MQIIFERIFDTAEICFLNYFYIEQFKIIEREKDYIFIYIDLLWNIILYFLNIKIKIKKKIKRRKEV